MALTARELVFYIRAENQASGVFRRVAADIRRLPSNRVINIQQRYNASTQQLLNSNQKYLQGVNLGIAAQQKGIQLRTEEISLQSRQLELAKATAEAQAAAARIPTVVGTTKGGLLRTKVGTKFGPSISAAEFDAMQKSASDAANEVQRIKSTMVSESAVIAGQAVQQKTFGSALKETLSGKTRSLQLSRAELDAQVKQNSTLMAYNRIQQQVAVNQANLVRAQTELNRLNRKVAAGTPIMGYTLQETASLAAAAELRVANLIQQQKILGDSADAVTTKVRAEGLALEEAASADKIARINMIAGAFSRVASAVRVAGIVAVAGMAVLAHSAATFQTQTTLAATQARPPGAPATKTAQIASQLNDVILKQMKQFPSASKDMADSLYQIFSGTNIQGISKAASFLKVFNQEAIAGGTSLGTMTDAMLTVTNNFDKGDYSIKTLTKNANIFFSAVRYGRMTADQFATALAYIVPIAKEAGSTFQNVAQDMAFFTRQTGGKLTRQDAQGYARLVLLLGRTDVAAGLAMHGIDVFTKTASGSKGKMRPLIDILSEVHKKMKLTPQETLNFFKTISAQGSGKSGTAGTIQAIRIFAQAQQNAEAYRQVVKEVTGDNNEFTRSFQAMKQTPQVQLQILTNSMKALGLTMGTDAIPAFVKIGHYVVVIFNAFNNLSEGTKNIIAQVIVFGGAGAILAGTIVKISAASTQLLYLFGILGGNRGVRGLGTEAGFVNVKMALLAGSFGLLILLATQFPHQIMPVVDALGGLDKVLIAIGLAMAGARIGSFVAEMRTAVPVIESVGATATVATAQLGLFEAAEGAAVVETGILAGALSLLFSPVVIGAGIALLVGGLIYLMTRATAAEKAIKNLRKAIDQTASGRSGAFKLTLNLDESHLQLKQAQDALKKTKTGTIQWREAVLRVKEAMIGVKDAQKAVIDNNTKINQGLQNQLINVLKLASAVRIDNKPAINPRSNKADPLSVAATNAKGAANATQDFINKLDSVAMGESKLRPLYAHNLWLIMQMTEQIGHIPNAKELKILLNNKNFKAQLSDFIDQMPSMYKSQLEKAGELMGADQGAAWLNSMQVAFGNWNTMIDAALFPGMKPNHPGVTKPPKNPIGQVSSQYEKEQAAAKKLAAKNSTYTVALGKVAALDIKYMHSHSLADEQAFYNAKKILDKNYGDAYAAYTSDYLGRAEAALNKSNKKTESAAKKHMKTMQTIWAQAATTLQSNYQSVYQQNQSALGTLFQGPFITSGPMQDEISFGHKLTGNDLIADLKSQITQFKEWNKAKEKLVKANIPYALLQQIDAAGPAALPEVKALLSLKPARLQSYFTMFKKAEVGPKSLLSVATGSDLKRQLKFYRTFGHNAALQIIQGLRDADTPLLSYFEDMVAKIFPGLAKAAKGHPAPKIKGSAGPKIPDHVTAPKIPKAKIHTGHAGEHSRGLNSAYVPPTGGMGTSTNKPTTTEYHDHYHFEGSVDSITQNDIKSKVRKATFHKRSRFLT